MKRKTKDPGDFEPGQLTFLPEIMRSPEIQKIISEALREANDQRGRLVIPDGEQRMH